MRIPPTAEQLDHDGVQMRIVSSIVRKRYISEMDLLRLQKALLLARMNADSTYLVDRQEPGYSSKLERLARRQRVAEAGGHLVEPPSRFWVRFCRSPVTARMQPRLLGSSSHVWTNA